VFIKNYITVLGPIPMCLATWLGSDTQRPLAAVISGSIMVSAILPTMSVIPVLYGIYSNKQIFDG
jgi:Cu/Ag efflux pump CusA